MQDYGAKAYQPLIQASTKRLDTLLVNISDKQDLAHNNERAKDSKFSTPQTPGNVIDHANGGKCISSSLFQCQHKCFIHSNES